MDCSWQPRLCRLVRDNNYVRDHNYYEQLFSLDVLGVEDREDRGSVDNLCRTVQENITRKEGVRYEVAVLRIPGAVMSNIAYGVDPSRNTFREGSTNQRRKACPAYVISVLRFG